MILALLALLAAQPADCRNAMTQADIDACAAATAHDAEAAMNRAAALLMDELKARDRASRSRNGEERLIAAQRAWIAFRDAECRLAGLQAIDGSLESVLVAQCLSTMNGRRADELRMLMIGR